MLSGVITNRALWNHHGEHVRIGHNGVDFLGGVQDEDIARSNAEDPTVMNILSNSGCAGPGQQIIALLHSDPCDFFGFIGLHMASGMREGDAFRQPDSRLRCK